MIIINMIGILGSGSYSTESNGQVIPGVVRSDVHKIVGQPGIPDYYLSDNQNAQFPDYPDTNGNPRPMKGTGMGDIHHGYKSVEVKDHCIIKFCPVTEDTVPLELGMEVVMGRNPSNPNFYANQKCFVRALREPLDSKNKGQSILINAGDKWAWVSIRELESLDKTNDFGGTDNLGNKRTAKAVVSSSPTQMGEGAGMNIDDIRRSILD